jgi:hypothetical protein
MNLAIIGYAVPKSKVFFTPHPDPLPSRGEGIIKEKTLAIDIFSKKKKL